MKRLFFLPYSNVASEQQFQAGEVRWSAVWLYPACFVRRTAQRFGRRKKAPPFGGAGSFDAKAFC
jgi:hypothetical protein